MQYPYFTRGLIDTQASRPAAEIPTIQRIQLEDPSGYVPNVDLAHAVNVALVLGMPLLLTGEPGTGKTQLAYSVAQEIGAPVQKFETKSTSAARDLFYTFDALTSFKMRDVTDQRMFIRYQALGRAILDAFAKDHEGLVALLPPPEAASDYVHYGPRRSVVLVDEIDKAPRDFPNDLLNEIDRLYFRVPELRNAASPGADDPAQSIPASLRPIMIFTSNSEKGLPDPFLRRCIYYDIPFPGPDEMRRIVANRVAGLKSSNPLLDDALDLFYKLRHSGRLTALRKEPSTAEFLNWLQILLHRGAEPRQSLKVRKDLVVQSISALVKSAEDMKEALEFISFRW